MLCRFPIFSHQWENNFPHVGKIFPTRGKREVLLCLGLQDEMKSHGTHGLKDLKDLKDLRDFRDLRDLKDFKDFRDFKDYRVTAAWRGSLLCGAWLRRCSRRWWHSSCGSTRDCQRRHRLRLLHGPLRAGTWRGRCCCLPLTIDH